MKNKHVMFRCGLDAHASHFVQYLEQYSPQGLNVSKSHKNTKGDKLLWFFLSSHWTRVTSEM